MNLAEVVDLYIKANFFQVSPFWVVIVSMANSFQGMCCPKIMSSSKGHTSKGSTPEKSHSPKTHNCLCHSLNSSHEHRIASHNAIVPEYVQRELMHPTSLELQTSQSQLRPVTACIPVEARILFNTTNNS